MPKIKKILLYEMKFLVPNYRCLQNPWLGSYAPRPQIPVLSVLCPLSSTEFVEPPRKKFLGTPLAPVTLSPGKEPPHTYWIACWVGSSAGPAPAKFSMIFEPDTSELDYRKRTAPACVRYVSLLDRGLTSAVTPVITTHSFRNENNNKVVIIGTNYSTSNH